jgi:hypothetical protein
MKKVIAAFLASLAMLLMIPASSFAAASKTDITGTVYNNGKPVVGAKVVVVCNNNSRKDTTDSTGAYLVQFTAAQCPAGDKATVVATYKKLGGTNSATISSTTDKLNVNIVNVSLPEFGVIAGVAAAIAGAGAFLVIRRKQLAQN